MPSAHPSFHHVLKRVGEPDPLVTLDEAKAHLRVDHTDEDYLIEQFAEAATATLDGPQGQYGYPVTTQRWSLETGGPDSDGHIHLPVTPAVSLFSVAYWPDGGGPQVVHDSAGELAFWRLRANETWAYIEPTDGTWPPLADRDDAVTVVWTAGYEAVPHDVKQAARFLIGHYYANREAVITGTIATELPVAVEHLVALRRRWWMP